MHSQGQGLHDDGSMDPDDDLGDDDGKDDDHLTDPYHGPHAHMHSIPQHQMGHPIPGLTLLSRHLNDTSVLLATRFEVRHF